MIETQDYIYIIEKTPGESNKFHSDKCLFMSKFNISNEQKFTYYLKFANIYCNKKYFNIDYSKNINNELNKLIN